MAVNQSIKGGNIIRFGKSWDEDEKSLAFEHLDVLRSEKLQEFLEEGGTKRNVALGVAAVFLLFVASYGAGFLVLIQKLGEQGSSITSAFGLPFWRYPLAAFTSLSGWLYLLLAAVLIAGIGWLIMRKNNDLDQVEELDSRGVGYARDGTYGTARWMSPKEAKKEYEIGPIDQVTGVILGQYTEGGKECVCLPQDTKGNRNILVLGSPGTGKSYCYVRNAIFQAIIRGESVVITDPKGELYESTSEKLRQEGYKVFVFNLVDPKRSDAWNCISEIYDPENGDVSDVRVTEFADTVMRNTAEGKDDHFWGTGENNLLKAIIMFCAWNRETHLKAIYEYEGKALYGQVRHMMVPEDGKKILDILEADNIHSSMREREMAIKILVRLAKGDDAVTDYLGKIHREAPPCDIASIYHMLVTSDIKALEEKFKAVPVSHPAGIAWSIFKNGSDNVRPGIVQGLAQRLQLFQMRDIRRITTNDDIHFEDLGVDKTALFVIISDKSTAMRALTSLFFTFLFKDVADAADRFGPQTRLPVNVICDEFANLGTIPQFDVTISTVRSRKINISIILQSVMQLEKNYEEARETIISCCDTVLFLGCNDVETANFISDLSGVASIRVLSTRDRRNTSLGNRTVMQGYDISDGAGKRNLLNPDEVRRIPREDVIIYHNGRNILQVHRCGFDNHRFYREGLPPEARLRDYPLASEKYMLTEELDTFVQADVSNLTRRNREILTNESLDEADKNARSSGQKGSVSAIQMLDGEENAFQF